MLIAARADKYGVPGIPWSPGRPCIAVHVTAVLVIAIASASLADDWPQWRGSARDGRSAETGLLKSWPAGGPTLLRTIHGIGTGHSSPAIAGGRVYITGKAGSGLLHVFCMELDGTKRWVAKNGPVRGNPSGARSSPTVDGDALYVLSAAGRLAAFATRSGRELWSLDILEKFGGRNPKYSYAESVLISGEKLICQPGGPQASIVALSKRTGRTIWKSQGMDDSVTYCSATLSDAHGVLQIVVVTEVGVVGVEEATGRLLWRYDKPYTGARNCLTPICWREYVFVESGHRGAGAIVRLKRGSVGSTTLPRRRGGGRMVATPVWDSPGLPSHLGGYVGLDGYVYGHDGRAWVCRELKTGKEMFRARDVKNCSTIYADGRFYCLSNKGTMSLVAASPKGYEVVGSFELPNAGPKTWARPAIAEGKLFIRNKDSIFIYGLRK